MKEFKNLSGESISSQQLNLVKDYEILNYENDNLKYREIFFDNSLKKIFYKKDSSEDISSILSLYPNQRITIEAFIEEINSYTVEENLTYENSILIEKEKEVTGEYGAIYIEHIDVNNNLPLSYEKYKFRSNGDWLYFFEYNNDGTLRMITYFDENNGPEQFLPNTERANQIDWNDLQYYQSASPMIPV